METKKTWETPTIKKLSINKETQNIINGTGADDGASGYTQS